MRVLKEQIRIQNLFILIAAFYVLFFLTSCATISRQKEIGLESKTVEQKKLEISLDFKFEDIPLPSGFKFNKQESFIFQSDFTRVGLLKYTGKASADKIVDFYREQMPLHNWDLVNIVEYGKVILNFEKSKESCIISLEPIMTKTILIISLGPRANLTKGD